jgi:hypothetical protein
MAELPRRLVSRLLGATFHGRIVTDLDYETVIKQNFDGLLYDCSTR